MVIFTLGFFLINILIATDVVRCLGVRRISFALLMSYSVLIAFYYILFNLLGLFALISYCVLFCTELTLVGLYFYFRYKSVSRVIGDLCRLIVKNQTYLALLLPLLLLTLLAAVAFHPNNQDSMSYHLARVVHWMNNQSIDYYYTNVDRQNRMGPGAEVIILFLQLLSDSDRLANLVQFTGFTILCLALPDLLRSIGIRRENVLHVALFTLSAPMLVLQASSTQNDIISGVFTWALILVLFKIYRQHLELLPKPFFILAGLVLAGAYLVKPTSILILLPLAAFTGVYLLFKHKASIVTYGLVIIIGLTTFIIVAGPDLVRKFSYKTESTSFDEIFYPVGKEWDKSRMFNVLVAASHHSPLNQYSNRNWLDSTAVAMGAEYNRHNFEMNMNSYPHEDYAGNPFHFIVFLLLSSLSIVVVVAKRFHPKFLSALIPLFSFIVLGLFIKDNPWISRIHLPFFLILPFCFISIESIRMAWLTNLLRILLLSFSFFCLSLACLTVSQNAMRPLSIASILNPSFSVGDEEAIYYVSNKERKAEHDKIITISRQFGLKKVGVIAGEDFFEYPLSWRLHEIGVTLVHIDSVNIPEDIELIYTERATSFHAPSKFVIVDSKIHLIRRPNLTLEINDEIDFEMRSLFTPESATTTDRGIFLYGNGEILSNEIVLRPGDYSLILKTTGADIDGEGSHWIVRLNDKYIGDIFTVKTGQVDSIDFSIEIKDAYRAKLNFVNDFYDHARGLDRNAEIQMLKIVRSR